MAGSYYSIPLTASSYDGIIKNVCLPLSDRSSLYVPTQNNLLSPKVQYFCFKVYQILPEEKDNFKVSYDLFRQE